MSARSISQLATRFAKLQNDLRAAGLGEVADKMSDAGMILVKRGLEAYGAEQEKVRP